MTITELKAASTGKLIDARTGRIMTRERAKREFDEIRMVDPEVVRLARRLIEFKENGGQMKLDDFTESLGGY